jgi:DNA-binding HxlR family transcriptional regulator
MALLDLLGRRWAMRIIWELRAGPQRFGDLRARCGGISTSVMTDRLAELETARIVERREDGVWALTPIGHELLTVFVPLNRFSERWARAVR